MTVITGFTICQQMLAEMKMFPEFMLCLSSLLPSAFPPRGIIGIRIFLSYNWCFRAHRAICLLPLSGESFISSKAQFYYFVLKSKVWVHITHSVIGVRCNCFHLPGCLLFPHNEWFINAALCDFWLCYLSTRRKPLFIQIHTAHIKIQWKLFLLTISQLDELGRKRLVEETGWQANFVTSPGSCCCI